MTPRIMPGTKRILFFLRGVLMAGVLAGVMAGCKRSSPDNANNTAPTGPVVPGNGIISGKVVFEGTPPVLAPLDVTVCHPGAPKQLPNEAIVVRPGSGAIQNVVVYLKEAPAGPGGQTRKPVILDQVDCHYVPHVVAVQTNQTVFARNSDPCIHNVHGLPRNNPPFNIGQTRQNQQDPLKFPNPDFIPIRCDVHPWMSAWIAVLPNPYFAVTGPDGHFQITHVPPGQYTLIAWHERFGTRQETLTVADDKPVETTFTFKAPK